MDPELKEYLDALSVRRQREFEGIMACFKPLDRSMQDTVGSIVGPLPASSDTVELVTAPVGLDEPPATVPIAEESAGIVVAVPNSTSTVAPAFCSMECPSHEAIKTAPAFTTEAASTSPTATVDVIPLVDAASASDGSLDRPSTNQRITSKVTVHRPMPWPYFSGVHVYGDATRPQPWPSFREINNCEFPSDAVEKASWRCISASSHAKIGIAIEFQISYFHGNLFTSTGYIIAHDQCNSNELRCLNDVLLFHEYRESARDFVRSVHKYHTTLVWLHCTISGFHLLVMVKSLKLKLLPNGSTSITLLTVLLGSGNFAALSCEYLRVETIVYISSGLFDDCSLVCHKSSVQSSTDLYPAREFIAGLLGTMDWHLLDFPCKSSVTACLSCIQEPNIYLCSSQLKEPLILNSRRRSNSSYDQLLCPDRYTSCLPGYFVTGNQMQVPAPCSTRHMFPSAISSNFHLVVKLELQLTRTGSHFVYLQVLWMDGSGIEGTALTKIIINVNPCRLKWTELILAYPTDLAPHCSSFSESAPLKSMDFWWSLPVEDQLSCLWSLPVEEHGPGTIVCYCPTTEILVVVAMNRNSSITSVLGTVNQEDQFIYLLASLNILEKNLEKPCSESEEPILSGLISRDTHPEVQPLNNSVPCCVHQYNFALFQLEIAWKPNVKADYFDIGVHSCHGKIFEGCLSVHMTMVMLYVNYNNLNSSAWYTPPHCTSPSVVQIWLLVYGNQRSSWGIVYGAFLKYNHYICCWYAMKPWSPPVHMVYIYWLLHGQVSTGIEMPNMQQPKWLDISVFSGYNKRRHVTQSGFELILWRIAGSLHWECPEIASVEFNNNLLPHVDEKTIKANFIFLCYGAGAVVTLFLFATTFRPTTAYSPLDTMKHNNSTRCS